MLQLEYEAEQKFKTKHIFMHNNQLINFVDTFFEDYRPALKVIYPTTSPSLNVKEMDDKYQISLTIPGLNPKDIKVNLTENVLSINYEHKDEQKKEDKDGKLLREEYRHYSFSRTVSLPKNIDADSIKADSKDGILTINVHKLPESQPKSVDININ
jgi:HSP20 family protein